MERPSDAGDGDEALHEVAAELGVLRGEGPLTADEIRTLFALSHELFVVAGFDGRIRLVSQSWTATLGHTAAELCAAPFIDFVHPDDRSMTRTVVERLTHNGRLVSYQNRWRHRDGSYRALSWRSTVSVEKQRFYAVALDVTEGIAARRDASVLSAIVETAGEAIILQSVDGIITGWSPGAERLCGWAEAEVVGKPMSVLAKEPPSVQDLRARIERSAALGRRDGVLVHKDGHEVRVSVAVAPFDDGTGHVTGAVTLARALPG
jgi:PAS domain S-box-containing protein